MNRSKTSILTLTLLFMAFVIGVVVRYIWVYYTNFTSEMLYNGTPLIVSPDGYHYMVDAKKILLEAGGVAGYSLSYLTAFLAKILPFSFETIVFYMPAYFASLLVIPVFYITKRFGSDFLAFGAALLSAVIIAYYRRTMAGYYDTDMLVVVLPMFIYWFLIESVEKKSTLFASLLLLFVVIFALWLPSDIALNLSIVGIFLLYTLIFDRKSIFNYTLFIAMLVAAVPVALIVKLPVVLVLLLFLHYEKRLNKKISISLLVVFLLAVAVFVSLYHEVVFHLVWQKISYYLHKNNTNHGMHFANSASFVVEDSHMSYAAFATRASGSIFVLPLAFIGYVLMVLKKKHRILLLLLPMFGFGIMAYGIPGILPAGGLRFVIYLAPVVAISLAYFIIWAEIIVKGSFHSSYYARYLLLLIFLYPNIAHTFAYKPQDNSVNGKNIIALEHLKQKISKDDTIISWWDYGYILQYYAQAKTVADGGWQLGQNLYPISLMFLSESQDFSAKLTRLISKTAQTSSDRNYLYDMMQLHHYKNPDEFLKVLADGKIVPKQNIFDTYIYLPQQIISLYSTMDSFARTDTLTGKIKGADKYYFLSEKPVNLTKGELVSIGNGILYVKSKQQLFFKEQNGYKNITEIYTISYDKNNNIFVDIQHTGHQDGYKLISLYNKHILIANKTVFNSLLVQLGVLQNYNSDLFEAVVLSPSTKIYKLKKR